MSDTVYTRGKSLQDCWRYVNLWNNLGFSLYAVLSVCHMVTTSDKRKKSKIEVHTDSVLLLNTRDQVQ